MSVKFRLLRGTLADSMETVITISGRAELLEYLEEILPFEIELEPHQISLSAYAGDDRRNGWQNYLVMKIEINLYYVGGCWNADYTKDEFTCHLTEAFTTEVEAFIAVVKAIKHELIIEITLSPSAQKEFFEQN